MKKLNENYLDKIPVRNKAIRYTEDDAGVITLEIDNKGVFNLIAQKLFKKPKVSYVHLDEMGSFIWRIIDGESNVTKLGKKVETQFGEKANPLYERLSKYISILESYGFVKTK